MSNVAWTRLVRFVAANGDGSVQYGEPIVEGASTDIAKLARDGKLEVHVCSGEDVFSAKPTAEKKLVKKLLGPLKPDEVPIIRCIGLNYKTHSKNYSLRLQHTVSMARLTNHLLCQSLRRAGRFQHVQPSSPNPDRLLQTTKRTSQSPNSPKNSATTKVNSPSSLARMQRTFLRPTL